MTVLTKALQSATLDEALDLLIAALGIEGKGLSPVIHGKGGAWNDKTARRLLLEIWLHNELVHEDARAYG